MLAYEGRSVPTTYLPTGSASSDTEDPSMLFYGLNTRTDTRDPEINLL